MKKFLPVLFVLLFGIVATIDLLHPGFPVTNDGQDHIVRIANFYLNLEQGVWVPRWAENLNYGYGHPVLEFLYPFPSYVASLFHFLGANFIDATKIVYVLGMIGSGIAMYLFARALWGESAGIVAGVLYMYAPYRFVDLYVRGDIGENMSFVFIPLVLWGMYRMLQKQTIGNVLLISVSLGLLIMSHNAVALIMVPFILLYGSYLTWQKKWNKKIITFLSGGFLLGFLLSAFFWFPALLEGQYTLRNIVTKGQYLDRFVPFSQLIYSPWNYSNVGTFTMQLGLLHWLAFIISTVLVFVFWKKQRATALFLGGVIIYTLAAIFLMLPASNFLWSHIMMLQNFQFPWRFLAIPVFTLSLLGGFLVSIVPQNYRKIIVAGVVIVLYFLSKDYIHANAYEQKPESFFTGIYDKTTDTGESAPMWSVRFMEHGYSKPLQVIGGSATITPEKRLVTSHSYTIASIGTSRLLENTLYFPGWKISVDGTPVAIQFQDPQYRGLMTFFVGNGTHEVVVSYHESKLRIIGDVLSVFGIFVVGSLFILKKKKYLS